MWRPSRASRNSERHSSSTTSRFSGRFSSQRPNEDDDTEIDVDYIIARDLWKNHKLIPPNSSFLKWWFGMITLLVLVRRFVICTRCTHLLACTRAH